MTVSHAISHVITLLQSYVARTPALPESAALSPLSNLALYGVVAWLVSTVALALWMRRFNTPLYVD